ncbi:hypothetical protein [Acidicapsa acidisoli]|uniref:hypothetical protein n=1 Tax=Acidicapsa acidisoli TaxID=1615681 RepID=UPI0021E030CE|nr:hypothetical protein [Acidicapsa acidisoli]
MSTQADILNDAVADIGQQYYWEPSPNTLYAWATGDIANPAAQLGTTSELAINCYTWPLLLAVNRGYLTKANVKSIIGKTIDNKADKTPYAFTTSSVTQLWTDWKSFPGSWWRPRAGDLVFFEGLIGGLLGHVAISTGNIVHDESEVISFGHGLTVPQLTAVARTTIERIRTGYLSIRFLTPSWP